MSVGSLGPDLRRIIDDHGKRIYGLERRRVSSGAGTNVSDPATVGTGHVFSNSSVGDNSSLDGDGVVPFTFSDFGGPFGLDGNWVTILLDGIFAVNVWGFVASRNLTVAPVVSILVRPTGGGTLVRNVKQGIGAYDGTGSPRDDPDFSLPWFGFAAAAHEIGVKVENDSGGDYALHLEITRFG